VREHRSLQASQLAWFTLVVTNVGVPIVHVLWSLATMRWAVMVPVAAPLTVPAAA